MDTAISAAVWVVGKALAPVSDGLLENWAACDSLGPNISTLKRKLLHAQGILYTAHGRDITNPALKDQLHMLRQLADEANDVLDELDYFCIQDKLDSTYDAADNHPGGCIHNLNLNVRHTARAFFANKFKISPCWHDANGDDLDSQEDDAKQGCLSVVRTCGGKRVVGSGCIPKGVSSGAHVAGHVVTTQTGMSEPLKAPLVVGEKNKFHCVEMSKKMAEIVQQLEPMCAEVKDILDLELRKPTQGSITGNRPTTTPAIIEIELFGRNAEKKDILDGINNGKYCTDGLTVLPVVGPGGIGKTTFIQHVYREVKSSFDVMIWVCVSLSFNANRLTQEIVQNIPKVNGETENTVAEELIEQRLRHKRFLLVLDDMWIYHEYEWKKLLAPFEKGHERGNMVIVTTRIPETATMVKTIDYPVDLTRLGADDFMHLFEKYVFGDQEAWKDHPKLLDVGKEIVVNLKGFPLAAKTVGRLLRNQLTLDHWTRVLESKEWELQTSDYDIMPALKLSYDYLPFYLQQCFSYCGLFPEDYEFGSKELVHLWIGLDFLDSCDGRKTIEDVGLRYLNDLVNSGFLKKTEKDDGSHCYVVHDLLHNLAVKVSSSECLSISSSNVRYVHSSLSVRHLSIIVNESDVNDRLTFDDFKSDLSALHTKLKVEKLQTVMLFGKYHGSFAKAFGDLFAEAKALRVILLSEASYSYKLEDVFHNIWRFFHLRYLRIIAGDLTKLSLNSNISRFYHLRVLNFQQCNVNLGPLRAISNLVKLRHFLVKDIGFELKQIAQLAELGGLLRIHNIENVERKEGANKANLIHKNHLEKLILRWGVYGDNANSVQEQVLEILKPHSNLLDLHNEGHRGAACPSWLGGNLSVKNLESLCLHDIGWKTLPPLGELWSVGELGEERQSSIPSQSFQNLKRLELVKIPWLRRWVENSTCRLFSQLEVLIVKGCSELVELPFSRCQSEQEAANMTWFPRLQKLEIMDCPKLLSLPPIPWTLGPCSAEIMGVGSGFEELWYSKEHSSKLLSLSITGKGGQDGMFWNILAFSNLADLNELRLKNCSPLPMDHLQKLTSLKSLEIENSSNVLSPTDSESDVTYKIPIECLSIRFCGSGEKELTQLLSHFPDLSDLAILDCEKITRVGVVEQQQQATRGEEEIALAAGEEAGLLLSLLSSSITSLSFNHNHEVERFTKEQEDALQLLTSLEYLSFLKCGKLQCLPAGLHRLSSLQTLCIQHCEAIKSLPKDGLPTSLQFLHIIGCPSLKSLTKDGLPSSLEKLSIIDCPALKSLPSHGLPDSLRVLHVEDDGNSEELMRQCRKLKGIIPIIID
ncbi:hypothetical protein CFC21_100439 [Triticum aestivum]|uniref:AAA+ ATPase domain-containing protein n=2 Tax=Triticum aestivum TaxID=4565 RepID=A0A3B6RNG3_WHEAT|nr:hypothetical protein CFC21_100439 [Triticum aestivum]